MIDFIIVDNYTQIITWEITESFDDVLNFLTLNDSQLEKFEKLSPKRKKEYLGLRACLKTLNLDLDVFYNLDGSPYISNDYHISISHSHGIVCLGLSDYKIGVDIEKKRTNKIFTIKNKFIRKDEDFFNGFEDESDYLHIIWGIKEALYKLHHGNLWSFTNHYKVDFFDIYESKHIKCWVTDERTSEKYFAYFNKVNDCYLVYVLDYEVK